MLKKPVTTVWIFVVFLTHSLTHSTPPTYPPLCSLKSVQTVWQGSQGDLKKGKIRFPEKTSPQHCVELGQLCEKNRGLLYHYMSLLSFFLFFPLRYLSERYRSLLFCCVRIHSKLITIVNTFFRFGQTIF